MSAKPFAELMRKPDRAELLTEPDWNDVLCAARAERLLGTLAAILDPVVVPDAVRTVLADARFEAEREKRQALWEADRALAALAPLDIPIILLKGAAYAAAGLAAGEGRMIGDLDILVPHDRLDDAEAALLAAGWEWVKEDPYDDAYYRRWMHELPPLIHRDRDRMIDVHHTILPLTARPMPDSASLIEESVEIDGGLRILSVEDRVCHAVAHMLADGDLAGGLRNLWDIACLLGDIEDAEALDRRAAHHGLATHLALARRLVDHVYGEGSAHLTLTDRLFLRRLMSRDGWGRDSRKLGCLAFYIRSHLLRMPLGLLVRHLWAKWRKGYRLV